MHKASELGPTYLSTTLVATSSVQGHWHVGHWCSDTGTGQRAETCREHRYGLRARLTMMMMIPVYKVF